MEQPYSNREIDSHFQEVQDKLDLILAQTTKTNGRVNKLEFWRAMTLGGASIVTLIVLPLLIWIFNDNLSSIRTTVSSTQTELAQHEKEDKLYRK